MHELSLLALANEAQQFQNEYVSTNQAIDATGI